MNQYKMNVRDALCELETKLYEIDEEINELNMFLVKNDLEEKCLDLKENTIKNINNTKKISKSEWKIMLPKEKEENYFYYYWCRRSVQYELLQQHEQLKYTMEEHFKNMTNVERIKEKIDYWLDNTWVKVCITGVSVASGIITLMEVACTIDNSNNTYKNILDYKKFDNKLSWKVVYNQLIQG